MHEQDLLCITDSVVFFAVFLYFTEAYRDFILFFGNCVL